MTAENSGSGRLLAIPYKALDYTLIQKRQPYQ